LPCHYLNLRDLSSLLTPSIIRFSLRPIRQVVSLLMVRDGRAGSTTTALRACTSLRKLVQELR